jgi:hypothetical protein
MNYGLHPAAPEEHYVTIFDRRFLLQGLALHESLRRHDPRSILWVLCLDTEVARQLEMLKLTALRPLPLCEVETPDLLAAKRNRSGVEYIFTLTPFIFEFIFDRHPSLNRVTYVDADLYFFKSPESLFQSLERAGRHVLITEHGFPPGLDNLNKEFGRFCVQFLPVRRTAAGIRVIRRWQRQCLENCSIAKTERTRVYGDQKYLDEWPERYPEAVHVCPDRHEMLGPWNVDHYQELNGDRYAPIFYHFHSLRVFHRRWVQLCSGFNPRRGAHLYDAYLRSLRRQDERLYRAGISRPVVPFAGDPFWLPRLAWRCLHGRARVRQMPLRLSPTGE